MLDPITGSLIGQLGSGLISGIGSLFGSKSSSKEAAKIQREQIQAAREMNDTNVALQREINANNIAHQKEINDQNIGFQKEINDLMRWDNKHAISDKRQDLMRAGYSTADPSMSGFTAASLGAPDLGAPQEVAPQVANEYDSSSASNVISAKRSSIQNYTDMLQTFADVALKRAQTTKVENESDALRKTNSFIEVEKNLALKQVAQSIENMVAAKELTLKQAEVITNELQTFGVKFDLLKEDLAAAKARNEVLPEQLRAELDQTIAHVAEINVSTDLKHVEKDLAIIRKDMDNIRLMFARMGIRFDSDNIVDSLARMFASPDAAKLMPKIMAGVKEMFSSLVETLNPFDKVVETVKENTKKAARTVNTSRHVGNYKPNFGGPKM